MAGACSRHRFIDANCETCHSDYWAKELREKNTPKIKCKDVSIHFILLMKQLRVLFAELNTK